MGLQHAGNKAFGIITIAGRLTNMQTFMVDHEGFLNRKLISTKKDQSVKTLATN